MPKRSSTETVLNNLTQGDKDANAAKAANLAKIPDPVWESAIDFNTAFSDHIFNARDDANYAFSANKGLYQSLKEKGLEKRGDPMAFHVEPSGNLLTLVGNLRLTMMTEIRREEAERRANAGEPADPTTLPFAKIFGLVYRGLTPGQKTAIMADHIGRKDLNEFERCKEIGEFIEQNGLTDDQAKTHFGMDKNKVRRYRMRWAMPTVMAEYRKEKAGKDSTESYLQIGQKQLEGLYSEYLKDRDAGNKHREEGPCFRRAWEKIKSDPTAFKAPGPKDKKLGSKERDTLLEQAAGSEAGFGDGFEILAIRDTLRFAAGEEENLNTIRQTAKDTADDLRRQITVLSTERDNFADLLLQSAETIAQLTVERDDAILTKNAALNENESLTARLTDAESRANAKKSR